MLVVAKTRAIWTIVAIVDNTAPATAAARASFALATRAPMAAIVAVLEMKPEARPAIGSPNRAPSRRTATYPAALIAMISMTITQIECGFKAPYGPMGRS